MPACAVQICVASVVPCVPGDGASVARAVRMADPWRGVREAIGRTRRMDSGRAAQAALEIYEGAYEDRAEAWRFLHGLASGDDALAGRDPVRIAAEQEVRRTSVRKEDARMRLRAVEAATWSLDRAWRFEVAFGASSKSSMTSNEPVFTMPEEVLEVEADFVWSFSGAAS